MKIYFSDFFSVDSEAIEDFGAFDISLINDLPLFIDPFLLFNSEDSVYQALHEEIIQYMCFLKDVALAGPISEPLLRAWFTFPEVTQNWLGFSEKGNHGHGLGLDFAQALYGNFRGAFADFGTETVTKGSHVEKLCLIKDGVGRDNISDFTANLIKGYLATYTQQFSRQHVRRSQRRVFTLPKCSFDYHTRTWAARRFELPVVNGEYVLLTPRDMLTKDEAWINRSELLDRFVGIAEALPDAVLRAQVNQYLARVLPSDPKASPGEVRQAVAMAVAAFPQVLDYYVKDKEDHGDEAVSVAQARVAEVYQRFVEQVRELVEQSLVGTGFYSIAGDTHDEAMQRAKYLKDVVENKGGHRFFYVNGEPIRRENDLHVLYRLTWCASPSDVSAEVNDGRGPADFKASRGASDKTIIEFKLATNKKLEQNLSNQTPVYEAASSATRPAIKVIFYFTADQLERVSGILTRLGMQDSPDVVLIDARSDNKPSGSVA